MVHKKLGTASREVDTDVIGKSLHFMWVLNPIYAQLSLAWPVVLGLQEEMKLFAQREGASNSTESLLYHRSHFIRIFVWLIEFN